jgi:hypothetical protein
MNGPDRDEVGGSTVWKATAFAVAVAAVLLVAVVLPAEYGIDPTSFGRLTGLDKLSGSVPRPAAGNGAEAPVDELADLMAGNTVAAEPGTHQAHSAAFRAEETVIRLESLEEVEVKARLAPGDTMLYSWEGTGPVYVDTHGEPFDYPDTPAVRYAEEDGITAANGRITAPIAGLHGWYWLNTNDDPITITLKTSGYYEELGEIYRNRQ